MIIYKLTGTKKISGHRAILTAITMPVFSQLIERIIAANFDDKSGNDYILLETLKVTIEVKK